jgi:hypothetical protein
MGSFTTIFLGFSVRQVMMARVRHMKKWIRIKSFTVGGVIQKAQLDFDANQ